MLLVAGIDPGLSGAMALYDQESDALLAVVDMPTVKVKIGASTRNRIDMPALRATLDFWRGIYGVQSICVEKVQGYGGKDQSASAAFAFGEVYGRVMAEAERVCDVDSPTPAVWKLREKIPLDAEAIVKKAEAEFPSLAALFRGPKGGPLHDRAEAAFLSRYCARRVWPLRAMAASADIGAPAVEVLDAPKPAPVAKSKRKARKAK